MALDRAAQITGRVSIEGGKFPKATEKSRRTISLFGRYGDSDQLEGDVHEDGTFQIDNIGSREYRVEAFVEFPAYIKSIQFNGTDVSGIFVEPSMGTRGVLNIVLSQNPAALSVNMLNASGESVANAVATIWPKFHILHEAVLGAESAPNDDGIAKFKALAPSDYFVLVLDPRDELMLPSREFRSNLESLATLVTLGPGSQEILSVQITPHDQILAAASKLP